MCSNTVVITWSPGRSVPVRAMFSASVELLVNMTCSDFGQPKKSASFPRVLYSRRLVFSAPSWAPREALPSDVSAAVTASATQGGFIIVVAALSR